MMKAQIMEFCEGGSLYFRLLVYGQCTGPAFANHDMRSHDNKSNIYTPSQSNSGMKLSFAASPS